MPYLPVMIADHVRCHHARDDEPVYSRTPAMGMRALVYPCSATTCMDACRAVLNKAPESRLSCDFGVAMFRRPKSNALGLLRFWKRQSLLLLPVSALFEI